MKRKRSVLIENILPQFLRDAGLETPLNQHRIIEEWYKLERPNVAPFTEDAYISNQTLYIKLNNPSLKANLMMQRRALAAQLNDSVRAYVIAEIVFI